MKPVELLVLTSPGCTHCEYFLKYWKEEGGLWENVTMKEIDILTEEGQALVRAHQIFVSPGIVINGELFSMGGFDKEKFQKHLERVSVSE